ncbi:uncharacterized protein [Lolium perenne]|uniref:uncharacterized protein n=1 Tax=Lolium perenne TaxID=4522 RepID=UPI0021F517DA|nr:uncharacterized protein LOC127332074 [Lolium perenne]
MSSYHVLNDQPIDLWKVTELKDELCRRNLPISGLKEDLVKRLFEDLQGDILVREGTVNGSSPDDTRKEDEATGCVDASILQAAMEPSVDENPSRVSTQSGDLVVSVTEASKESEVATGNVSQKFVVTNEEVSQKTLAAAEVNDAPLVDVVTTKKISLSGEATTKQDDLESAPSDSTMVKDVQEEAAGHSEFIAEKAVEEDAAKKTIVDHLFATTDVKLDVSPAKGKLDDDILEHEVVPSPLDAIVPRADHWDVDAVAAALGHDGDAMIPKISSVDNDLMNCKDHEDSGLTSNACKLTVSGPIDQTIGTLPATMPTYPVLNNQAIDQWKVTELKDELSKRNLPVKGLKDDLVKRLFKDLEGDILGGSPCSYDLKVDRTPGSADASVCQDVMEQNVDEGPSQVATQEGSSDTTTDVSHDAVATTEEVNQTTLLAATDSDSPLVDSATADTISLSDAVATKRDDLESAPSDGAILKGASLKADCHNKMIAEKAPEEGTIKEAIVDYLPYDVASTNVKLDATSAKGKLDADIVEKEAVLSLPDAIALHTDHLDVHAIATAPGQNAETLIPKIDSGDTFMSSKDREDSGHTNDACKPSLSGTKDKVSEANPDIGSQIKCVLISHEDISTNVKGDLNADNSDLELEAKRDMVKPQPCRIPSVGDDLQALDDEKQLCKKGTQLQEIRSMTNLDLDKKEDSPNGVSPEKVNLERTSGNESIEEDAMESKHVIPNIRSDDVGREIEVTSDHEVKEVLLFDTVDSSVQTKDNVAKEKSVAPSEKRKPEDQVVAVDPNKRQRRVDSVKLPKEQTSKSSSICPKGVVQPAIKRSFGRSGSVASGDSHIERTVPLSQKPATTSLKIDRFVRPFTLKAVQELLGRTGSICSFWMDHIKTHCYVTYSSVDEAVATRNAVYNLQWPLNNGSYLLAEFVDPREVKLRLEHPPPPPAPMSLNEDTTQQAVGFQQSKPTQTMLPDGAGASRGLLPTPQPLKLFPASKPGSDRDMLTPAPKEVKAPAMLLADLFKRTQASPMIYYLPLTEEEVAAKLAARSRRRKRG